MHVRDRRIGVACIICFIILDSPPRSRVSGLATSVHPQRVASRTPSRLRCLLRDGMNVPSDNSMYLQGVVAKHARHAAMRNVLLGRRCKPLLVTTPCRIGGPLRSLTLISDIRALRRPRVVDPASLWQLHQTISESQMNMCYSS